MHLIVSCSLNKNSKSKILANYASTLYNQEVKFLDLQTMELPFCDGDSCYDNPKVKELLDGDSSRENTEDIDWLPDDDDDDDDDINDKNKEDDMFDIDEDDSNLDIEDI